MLIYWSYQMLLMPSYPLNLCDLPGEANWTHSLTGYELGPFLYIDLNQGTPKRFSHSHNILSN